MNETSNKIRLCFQTTIAPNKNKTEIDSIKLRAVFTKNNLWPAYKNITVGFIGDGENTRLEKGLSLNEDPLNIELMNLLTQNPRKITIKDSIKRIVKERIEPIVNLKFIFVENPSNALVQISFKNDGSYADLGYDQNYITTVNFAWFNVDVVLHEFGHLLGMYHEHQSPYENPVSWDKEAVYKIMAAEGNWSKETTDRNILDNLDKASINGSTFDPLSIMQYYYPPEFTTNKVGSGVNARFSGKDVLWICKTYPKQNEDPRVTAENFYQRVYGESLQSSIDRSEQMAAKLRDPIIATFPPTTFPPVTPVPPAPTVPPVPIKSNSTIWIVFGIVFGLIIIFGVIALFINNKNSIK